MDMLVFMIAALLIPAWLLGHLFLTFYPAPETSGATVAEGSLFGENSETDSTGVDSPNDSAGDGASDSATAGDGEAKMPPGGATNPQLGALAEKSNLLQSEVDSLTSSNSELKAQIERLNMAASQTPATSETDSAAMEELQNKLNSRTSELDVAKQSLASATEQAKKYEQDRQQLQTYLSELQSKLEQTEADLASAKEAMNNEADAGSPFAAAPMEAAANENANLLQEQEAKVNELSAKVKELSYNLDNAGNTLAQRDEELRRAKQALEEVRAQNGNLMTALEKAKQKAAASVASTTTPPAGNGDGLKLMPREVYRDFVSSKGSVSKMAFVRWDGDDIIVRSFSNKRLYRLTLDRFSKPDQQYLLERKK